jgi:hypothetical protein
MFYIFRLLLFKDARNANKLNCILYTERKRKATILHILQIYFATHQLTGNDMNM